MSTFTQTVTNSTIHGSIIAAEKIEDSFNSLQASKTDEATQDLLHELLTEIKALNAIAPASQAPVIEKMLSRADGLINETKSEAPDREFYQISLKGLLEAAKAIGAIANPVLAVAKKLNLLLLG